MQKIVCFLLFINFFTTCISTQPNKEYALAQSALLTAKQFSADQMFPKTYSKALSFYNKGVSLYKKQDYEEARNSFEEAIKLAEKAEFKARLKKIRESE